MNSLAELAGQVLTIGIEGSEMDDECRRLLSAVRPGGVIFFQRNIHNPEQFAALVSRVQDVLGSDCFLSIDLEGGTVDRFRELIAPLPAAASAKAAGLSRELGKIAGRELAAFHLNLDYAPVLDLRLPSSERVLTTRTAGATPAEVINFSREFLTGLWEVGILGCGKHFPGLGGGNLDSHVTMPTIERSYEQMWSEDLLPYRELSATLPKVMVAHAWYPSLERECGYSGEPRPASVSPALVRGLLREQIGFRGLILCDDLEMGGVLAGRTIEQAAVDAIMAGCEVLLVCRQASNVERVHTVLIAEAQRSAEFRELLSASADHIRAFKRDHGIGNNRTNTHAPNLRQLREEIARLSESIDAKLAIS